MNESSDGHSEASDIASGASEHYSTASGASEGRIGVYLAAFAHKCSGIAFADIREYILQREFPTLISHSQICRGDEPGMVFARALCLIFLLCPHQEPQRFAASVVSSVCPLPVPILPVA